MTTCPWELIEEIGVMDAAIKTRVETLLQEIGSRHQLTVHSRPRWYYPERS